VGQGLSSHRWAERPPIRARVKAIEGKGDRNMTMDVEDEVRGLGSSGFDEGIARARGNKTMRTLHGGLRS